MPAVLIGIGEVLAKLKLTQKEAPVAAAFGEYEGAQVVMKDAKQRAPHDTHQMEKSGYVTAPDIKSGGKIQVEMGFGGPSEDYVVRQHEDTSLSHPHGEAKFLSNAMDAHGDTIKEAVARHVAAYLKTGRTTPVSKDVPQSPWESAAVGAMDEMQAGNHGG